MGNTNLFIIFVTGLVTGGLTCLAVQGGLLASTISQREKERLSEGARQGNAKPILYFIGAKLVAYTMLGFLLGWLGSFFELSVKLQATLQFAVVIFMIGTAGNLLNLHPFFRYFVIQPPRFLTKMVRSRSKSKDAFAPALLGALTVFIPCGTTQAMMALAVGSGDPLTGAAILFSFILGTSPLFFALGYFATKLGDAYQKKFFKFAAIAILFLAMYNLRGAMILSGFTFFNSAPAQANMSTEQAAKDLTLTISSKGYVVTPNVIQAGSQVTLHIRNTDGYTCAQAFTIPKLGIQEVVAPGETKDITFVAPSSPGTLGYSCSMGMYRGSITVI